MSKTEATSRTSQEDPVDNDPQLSLDLDIEVDPSPWRLWVSPERHHAQAQKLLSRIGLSALPSQPWDFESEQTARITDALAQLFPDLATLRQPEHADAVDQLVCLLGEWFLRYLDAGWIDLTDFPLEYNDCDDLSLYRAVTPGLSFPHLDWNTCTAELVVKFVVEDGFFRLAELISVGYWRLREPHSGALFSALTGDFAECPPFRRR